MLRGRHATEDLAKIVEELKTRDATLKDVVIVLGLLVKLVVGIRGNQVAIMKHTKVPLREPRTRDTNATKDEGKE